MHQRQMNLEMGMRTMEQLLMDPETTPETKEMLALEVIKTRTELVEMTKVILPTN
jgi:hypothetical protein